MLSESDEERVDPHEKIRWLSTLPGIGQRNKHGDFPILALTKDRKFRAQARASLAAMREQRNALQSYGDNPDDWPIATPEEISLNHRRHIRESTSYPGWRNYQLTCRIFFSKLRSASPRSNAGYPP